MVVLQLAENPKNRCRGNLMGLVAGDVALMQAGKAPTLSEHQKVIVRLVQEGKAIAFESAVPHRLEKPVLMCFLAKPDNSDVVGLRKTGRMGVVRSGGTSVIPPKARMRPLRTSCRDT